MNKTIILILALITPVLSFAQSPAKYAAHLKAQSIGPTVFGGRAVDLAVNPHHPHEFYVAYASGGLWHTVNNGQTLRPIFDHEQVISIGDIAVRWENPRTIVVGTGEANSSRSSYYGNGIYLSQDNGESWQHLGLAETHHIGRIILHPFQDSVMWIAALGHLYTDHPQRGVFKTTDGGTSWQKVLYLNDSTGAVDLAINPQNPDELYAATWERSRKAWNFKESGKHSGIFKSINGGSNWTRLNSSESGFPNGEGVGRIGLDIGVEQGKTVLYAILDNYNRRPPEEQLEAALTRADFETMTKEAFVQLDRLLVEAYLEKENFPDKYGYDFLRKSIENDKIQPIALKEYVEDANSLLFNTPVIGAEVYRSDDEGATWQKTHENYLDKVYHSYGYYFGQIRVSPHNADQVYIMGVPILKSSDGGANWESINGDNVHVDHHALWLNPQQEGHMILGNDGGVNITYDDGINWNNVNDPPMGQFYAIYADDEEPYNVYGGLQDNGVWKGPSNYEHSHAWKANGHYPYQRILQGDGMQIQKDADGNVYTGYQFGNYYRIPVEGPPVYLTPKHELGERPYRWNWQTPIHLSSHSDHILYMGANKLLRSLNRGEKFVAISPDLTRGGRMGDVTYGTITTIDESKQHFGKMVCGSDDGLIHTTRDGGNHWQLAWQSKGDEKWVSRVRISQHDDEVIYAAVNNMRNDDFAPYLYRSADFGTTWEDLSADLPYYAINVILEDPQNADILYVGNDAGVYVSINRGNTFEKLTTALPHVPVHDLVIKGADLLIGTHGRSIYRYPLDEIRVFADGIRESVLIFEPKVQTYSQKWGSQYADWAEINMPDFALSIYSNQDQQTTLSVYYEKILVHREDISLRKGINRVSYPLSVQEDHSAAYQKRYKQKQGEEPLAYKFLLPGTYRIQVGEVASTILTVETPHD